LNFILDTDIGPDVDDAGALYIANLYASKNMGELLCVTHCTSNPFGVGAIKAINKWCGSEEVPVGTLKDKGFLTGPQYERYNKALSNNTPSGDEVPEAYKLIRKTLALQPDASVTIIGIGPMRNLAHLLCSVPDEYSPLNGKQLINDKVSKLFLMAGCFDKNYTNPFDQSGKPVGDFTEWNVEMDVPSATAVFKEWPTPIIFGGLEHGGNVITMRDTGILPSDSPIKLAYDLYTQGDGRMSWDLLVTERGMNPDSRITHLSPRGDVTIDAKGVTTFRENPTGKCQIMHLALPIESAEKELDRLLSTPVERH